MDYHQEHTDEHSLNMGGLRVHHEFLCDPKKCDQCYMLLADVE